MFHRNFYSIVKNKSGRRKVGNTFAITANDFEETLQKLNNIDKNVEFAMKNAFEGNFPFLDCTISLNQKRNSILKEYKKPTPTCQYNHC